MSKKIKSLEKETLEWRSKYEKSTKAMLEMASDKTAQDQYVGKASRQLLQLQKLCRTLQAERTALLDVLKANNIERPPMPELPPEPIIEPPPKSADKLDIMSRNCTELKQTLALLQGQMNALTAEKTVKESNVTETAPPKKTKNKKNKTNKTCPIKDRAVGGAKVVNSKEKIVNITEDSEHQEEIPVDSGNNIQESDDKKEDTPAEHTKIEQMAERIIMKQNDVHVDQTTKDNIEGLVDELVNDIKTSCSLESQEQIEDTQARVEVETLKNGENDGVAFICSDIVESNGIVSPVKRNDAESVPNPIEITSN